MPGRFSDAAPAAATGALILIHAGLARFILNADQASVYVCGRPIRWVCSVRKQFGVPCPTCGLTRSVVLALHGHFLWAWWLAPGGAVAVAAGLALAIGLLVLAGLQATGSFAAAPFRSRLRRGALAGAAVLLAVWLGGWAAAFSAALHRR